MTKRPHPDDMKIAFASARLVKGAQAFARLARRRGLTALELAASCARDRRTTRAVLDDYKADPTGRKMPRFMAAVGLADVTPPPHTVAAASKIVPLIVPPVRSAPSQPKARHTMKTTLGDFLQGVRAQTLLKRPDPRVRAAAPSTAANENTSADGGILVPGDLAGEIIGAVRQNTIAGRCAQITSNTNNPMLPVDFEAPWLASGVYWEKELQTIEQRKPSLQFAEFRLTKLTALVPVSNEMLEDAPLFDAWCRVEVPRKIGAKLTTALIRGDGAAKLQGVLSSNCLITVTRGASVTETAATMWRRLHGGGRGNAVWLVNPDVDVPTSPGLPLLMHGQPVIAIEACSAAGQAGDIILADLTAYLLLARALQVAVSLHVFFDADAGCYRFVLRCAGQPLWPKAVQPENGSTTLSPFITVAAAA